MGVKKKIFNFVKRNYTIYRMANWGYVLLNPMPVNIKFPTNLNLEITTVCNSKCTYCTHEKLIKSGAKDARHMDLAIAKSAIDKMRELTLSIPNKDISFTPVGLGEPLVYPHLFEVLSYARKVFPGASLNLNTNCINLNENIAQKIIDSKLDNICLSLGFISNSSYKEYNGVDKHDIVVKSIKYFLKLKGNRLPRLTYTYSIFR